MPLAWLIDVGLDHPAFVASQLMFMRDASAFDADLLFHPDSSISDAQWRQAGGTGEVPNSRGQAAARLLQMQ